MKRCPACSRTYADDQNFCFDDGTTLVSAPASSYDSSDAPTVNYPFPSNSALPTQMLQGNPTASGTPLHTSPPPAFMPPYAQAQKRSPLPWIVGGLLILVVGIAAVIFLTRKNSPQPAIGTSSTSGTSGTSSTTPGASPSSSPSTTTTTSSSSWETINGDGFTLSMPGTPDKNESSVESAAGPLALSLYTLTKGYEGYITGYTEYPDAIFTAAEPEDLLDAAQEGAITNVEGEVTTQRKITIEGIPG